MSAGSDSDSAPDQVATTGGGAGKKTSAAAQKRDEVTVSLDSSSSETVTDVRVAGPPDSVSETATDLAVLPSDGPQPDLAWASATEPSGSVFAGRTDSPPSAFSVSDAMGPGKQSPGPIDYSRPPSAGPAGLGGVGAARPAEPGRAPRKAHLQLSRFEPLSVMKFSFVMSLVCFVVLLVAVTLLYMILSGLGVFDDVANSINSLTQDQNSTTNSFDASSWFSFSKIFGYTALIGGLNVLIITALSTVWSVIYNIAADFVGGVEVTLKEAE